MEHVCPAGDRAVRTEPILDIKLLTEAIAEFLRHSATMDVRPTAGGKTNHHAHWPIGIGLRRSTACRDDAEKGGRKRTRELHLSSPGLTIAAAAQQFVLQGLGY